MQSMTRTDSYLLVARAPAESTCGATFLRAAVGPATANGRNPVTGCTHQ